MIDKKNTFSFIYSILSSFYLGQVLQIVPSGTKYVKLWETIHIC